MVFKSLGIGTDVLNVFIKTINGDYYGAAGAAASALTTLAIASVFTAFSAPAIGVVVLGALLGYYLPDKFEALFKKFNLLGINSKTNTDFQSAQSFVQRIDPLVLDLDGDGIETVSANSGITFDFNGDGLKTGTGWLNRDDGFLVLDRNGNGTIDNGSELFGIDTVKSDGTLAKDGFDALRDLDSNGDGVFDAYDLLFEQVRVWQDKNQDGISQADELKSLIELGINAIHLGSNSSNQLNNGNRISATATVEFADGSTGMAANLDLASNPFYREFLDKLQISKAAEGLPDMHGSGAVRDLQEAASQSKELADLLTQYSNLPTREKQRAALGYILSAWADTAGYPSLAQRLQAAAGDQLEVVFQYSWVQKANKPNEAQWAQKDLLEKTAILEVFNASDFYKITRRADGKFILQAGANTTVLSTTKTAEGKERLMITEDHLQLNAGQADLLNQSYNNLLNSVYQRLLLQTRLKPYLEAIDLNFTEEGIALDYNGIYQEIDKRASDPVEAIVTSFELQALLQDPALSAQLENRRSVWISKLDEKAISSLQAQITDGDFNKLAGGQLLVGSKGSDTLYGNNISGSSSHLYGGAGDDTLQVYSYSKDNLLAGGTGNDTLYGSYYSDTYLFNLGDGKDTIIESHNYNGAVDTLRFGKDIESTDIGTYKDGRDLLFKHKNGKDEVRVKNVFSSTSSGATAGENYNLERIEFADGTVWTWQQIAERGITSQANNEGETLNGWDGNDIMRGGSGNDTLDAGYGSNQLYGGAGDDILRVNAYSYDNLLAGGKGNDWLYGSYYSDTYLFNLGDGKDTIIENYNYSSAVDILRFGKDIESTDIGTYKDGRDLLFKHKNGKDEVRVKNVFSSTSSGATAGENYNLERIEFADGTVWTWQQIAERGIISQANNEGETLDGWNGNDIIQGGEGDDILDASNGSNIVYGGAGNDTIKTGNYSFDNILVGGKGNDTLYGSYYSDTYLFNLGDGKDTIIESYNYSGAEDTLRFGKDIKSADIGTYRDGKDLLFKHKNGEDEVRVKNVFSSIYSNATASEHYNLERIEFADGTVWTWQQIAERGITSQANNKGETLHGWNGNDSMQGGKGDDILDAGNGSNTVYGGDGNDTIKTGNYSFDNILAGGKGNDWLYGCYNADTYIFNSGDGQDIIVEAYGYNNAIDIVQFGNGINPNNLWLERSGYDLTVSINKTDDRITIKDWYYGSDRRIEQFHLANGKMLLESQVQNLVDAMAAFTASSSAEGDFIPAQKQQLDMVIAASWQ
ncbi:hypothetical protein AXE65_08805 [Ventosimonas gracilis]|uniref:Haemolysin-type calcium binding-related domain-containing protein n=2 Tax=Ventosimonas gracilis TaxID=1680762 RepID=A0A139SXR0_9GAMM|nr:hypothetical protein AXE65_08805 [Ventosimonas gracilis]